MRIARRKSKAVSALLSEKFQKELAEPPQLIGSASRGTAVRSKFDLDILLAFRKGSFPTLRHMYETVYEVLEEEFNDKDLLKIRRQRRSLGLRLDVGGNDVLIDIVPGRKISDDPKSKDLKLYDCERGLLTDYESSIKTNLHKQEELMKHKTREFRVIRLLKVWRDTNSLKFKSGMIDRMVLKAFKIHPYLQNDPLYDQLQTVMAYMRDNIQSIKIVDPGNSNNVIFKSMSQQEKIMVAGQLDRDMKKLEKYPHYLKEIFPLHYD